MQISEWRQKNCQLDNFKEWLKNCLVVLLKVKSDAKKFFKSSYIFKKVVVKCSWLEFDPIQGAPK